MHLLLLTLALTAPLNRSVGLVEDGFVNASGVLLDAKHVLTAAHAMAPTTKIMCGTDIVDVRIIKISMVIDLALLELATPCTAVDTTALAAGQPEEGAALIIQGHPGGGPTRKTLHGYEAPYDDITTPTSVHHSMIMDARIHGGSSGGPVLNKHGELVGIVQGKLCLGRNLPDRQPPTCFGTAILLDTIKAFLVPVSEPG